LVKKSRRLLYLFKGFRFNHPINKDQKTLKSYLRGVFKRFTPLFLKTLIKNSLSEKIRDNLIFDVISLKRRS
jgi:hypothetical protein